MFKRRISDLGYITSITLIHYYNSFTYFYHYWKIILLLQYVVNRIYLFWGNVMYVHVTSCNVTQHAFIVKLKMACLLPSRGSKLNLNEMNMFGIKYSILN